MTLEDLPKDKITLLFDGVCNLCDASVQFIIKRDKKDVFRFVALQSELGQAILKHTEVNSPTFDSVVLYIPNKGFYTKSKAILAITHELRGLFLLFSVLSLLPASVSDIIYDYVAKNRYRWYGKKETCMMPTPQLQDKFLR